ncbi:MAG: Fur family transcriptional regulator [Clostridiales bacterium]|nr:Fur family transcriptional regulator [Clostridiales bacterium]HBM79350.1 transcriptional repressor [Clostridiaceae bacterium]
MNPSKLNIQEYLRGHGIKPSILRTKVLEYLLKYRSHPTVDEIYKALSDEIPTLSKTTIYNTLNLFVQKGITQVIVIEENETRYDADTSVHGHFKCQQCGKIYDVSVDISGMKVQGLDGFQVKEKHIYFKGICKECLKNNL